MPQSLDTGTYPPSTQPHRAGESSVGHGSSAGFAPLGPPVFGGQATNLSRANSTTPGRGTRDGDRFLNQAEGLELTQEDRQEGYDPELLNLQPRNTATAQADAFDRGTSPPPAALGTAVPASSLPYASRARDDSPSASKRKSTSTGGKGAKDRLGVRHHSSSATKDHHGRRRGTTQGASKQTSRKRKTKKLAWWQKPATLVIVLVVIIVIALAVGLGVGLSVGKSSSGASDGVGVASGSSSGSATVPNGVEPSSSGTRAQSALSTGDVQPSTSAAAYVAFGATAVPTTMSNAQETIVRRTVTRWV
ncbi:hypothetical protein JCM1840_004462 [Sporobolomyces johnsonii]